MDLWRYVSIISPTGDATRTVLKGDHLPAALLFHLGNICYSLDIGPKLPEDVAHTYDALHNASKALPPFSWWPDISPKDAP